MASFEEIQRLVQVQTNQLTAAIDTKLSTVEREVRDVKEDHGTRLDALEDALKNLQSRPSIDSFPTKVGRWGRPPKLKADWTNVQRCMELCTSRGRIQKEFTRMAILVLGALGIILFLLFSHPGVPPLLSTSIFSGSDGFNAAKWKFYYDGDFVRYNLRNYSQGNQDAVLRSLFSSSNLGTTNKLFVEFGFPDQNFNTSYGNGHNLRENLGFHSHLLLDGSFENPEINLHKRFITANNIVSIFNEFKVPISLDYLSVDMDSCDLWVFFAITKVYRPRVVTVEYNSNYHFGDFTTLSCSDPEAPGAYHFNADNLYGASLRAIDLAARHRGYSLVYVTPQLDLFFVRRDLLMQGTEVPIEYFAQYAGMPLHSPYQGSNPEQFLMDFRSWLALNPNA